MKVVFELAKPLPEWDKQIANFLSVWQYNGTLATQDTLDDTTTYQVTGLYNWEALELIRFLFSKYSPMSTHLFWELDR